MKAGGALLLVFLMLATAILVVQSQPLLDPLAPFRAPDGRLSIPGQALTPELQRLLFHRSELQPHLHITFPITERSSYPTAHVVPASFEVPNLNVFVHPISRSDSGGRSIGGLIREWFPPVNWHAVADGITASVRASLGWFFDLFTVNARADTLSVDSTTVTVAGNQATCTTSQAASAGDNAVLVMLSERGTDAYGSVTYGPVNLSLIPNTGVNNGNARTEMWFYQGSIPSGTQTMTATLSGGNSERQVCATILLRGVAGTNPTTGGTTASGTTANPSIAMSPAAGELAFAVLASWAASGTISPTAVTGTGATATDLYGVATARCTGGGGSTICGAGADLPSPGTAITWTNAATTWTVSAVRVVPGPNCSVAAGNCYRIGAGGAWNTGANWSNTSGGAACGCTPVATNNAMFNASPTGTTTLAAATTIASIDMTGFTGTLDTTASNWALTVNGALAIQGTFLARNSTVTVAGDVDILTAGTIVNLSASTWTVNGTWTNLSTSASWVAGTGTVTIRNAASGTLTFAALTGGTNEFNNLTLDASVTTSITYTMATNALRMGATLTIRNSTGGAAGSTILTTSGSNLGITAGALTLATFGRLTANGSAVTINGNVNISAANAYIVLGSSTWTVTGTWTNTSTSASWSAGTGTVTFTSPTGGTMTFAGTNLPGNEFNNITFTSSAASAQTFTMATRAMIWGGTLTVSDGSSTTALATANLGLTGGALNVGNGGILTANASPVTVSSVTMTGGTSGTITLTTSSFTSTGNWNTSGAGSVFTKGTSTVTMSGVASVAILNASNNFNNLIISAAGTVTQTGLVDVSGTLTVNAGAILASSTFTLTVVTLAANMAGGITAGAVGTKTITGNVSIAAAGFFNFGGATWNFNGSWTNSSTSGSWAAGTGTVTFTDAASQTMTFKASGTEFPNLTLDTSVAAGMTYTMATNPLNAAGTLTIRNTAGGATGYVVLNSSASNLALNFGALTLASFGQLNSRASTVTVAGNASVSAANAYVTNTGGSWTVSGSWTNSTTSGSWSFAALILFSSGSSQTMTFKASPTEFSGTVTFDTTIAAGITYTMATNPLTLSGLLTIQNTVASPTGNTILTTSGSNLGITAGSVTIGTNGTLTANGSTISVGGNWTVTAANATFTAGTSTVTFTAAATINMAQAFNNLTVSAGTSTLAANATVNAALTVSAGTLAKSTFTLSAATLTLSGGGSLTSTSGNATVSGNVNVSSAASYLSFGSESWTVTGSWTNSSTSASWGAGTGTVVFNAGAARTMTFGNLPVAEFNNVQFSPTAVATFTMATNGLRWAGTLTLNNNATLSTANLALTGTGGNLTVNDGGTLTAGASAVSVTNVTMTGGTSGTITASGSWTVAGNWDTSGAGSVFTGTSSTVTMNGAARTVRILNASNGFDALTISGTVSAASAITLAGLLTVSGTFDTTGTNYGMTVGGGLTVSGAAGILRTNASTVSVAGNVTVNNASGYMTSTGAGSWTASGSWTNASTSASWNFAASITFNSPVSQTMTFAVLPGGAAEFNDVAFNSGASTVTFTMATNPLIWAGTLTVQGGSGSTTLATSNLGLTGGALAVGDAGLLTANASTVSVSNVTMTSGTSGTLTLTTGTWTVNGNWDSSGTGSTLTAGSSTVTFTGTAMTIALAPGQMFNNLTIAGTISASSTLTVGGSLTVNNGAVLTKTGQSIAFNALTENGTGSIADGAISVVNFSVTNSDPTNLTTISVFTVWNVGAEYTWTHSSTVASSTITFTIGGNTLGYRFNVTKDSVDFAYGLVNGSGQVIFAMLGSDPVVDVFLSPPCGGSRHWIGGTDNWSQTAHWADLSGGVNGCSVPTSSNPVFFDANSGGGTVTMNLNASMSSLNTTGWTGTITIGSFDLVVSGDITHAAGVISIGASSNTGLTATGTLTLSGSAVLDGSGAPSLINISGDTSIASASAYFRMGSGTWTFGGSWSNGSTSANWTAGTGRVLFNSSSSRTMTFANLAGDEFYDVTFESAASSGSVTFTMATNGLRWSGALMIEDIAGSTTTLATANLPLTGGSLAVGDSGILTADASTVSLVNVTMTGGTSGTIALTSGLWTVNGNWDTSGVGSTFTKGTSTVTMSGTAKNVATLDPTNGFNNLTIAGTVTQSNGIDVSGTLSIVGTLTTSGNGITGGANLTVSGGGSLIGTTSSIVVAGVTMNDASANSISLTSGSISASGSWDTSGASSVFSPGSSTVTLTVASGTLTLGSSQAFAALVVAGSVSLRSALTVSSLTISTGGLAKGTYALTVNGNLTLAGGYLTSTSGNVSVTGNVNVSSTASYIAFGSEAWTVSGSWTNASTSASWSVGSGTVTFTATSSQIMTFAGTNLSGNEFSTVVFNSGSSTVAFTMASRGLVANAITIQSGSGTTTLATSGSDLAITADTLTVGSGGSLIGNGSVITVRSMNTFAGAFAAGTSTVVVSTSGGSINVTQTLYNLIINPGTATSFTSNITWSGVLTLTGATAVFNGNLTSNGPAVLTFGSSTISVAGSWNTSSATALTSTGSSVTFTGTSQSIALGAGQRFATLTIAGTVSLASDLTATSLSVIGSNTLTMTDHSISFNNLTVNGTIADGSVNVSDLVVTNSNATALVTIAGFSAWSTGSSYGWTHSSNETSQTITWTIGGNTVGTPFSVTKDGNPFASGTVNGSGQVVFTMLGSDPDMQVTVGVVPPPSGGWWQTSYWFVILPTGILLGVAMFAQRQRWRPAKAFLVDERGKMLREFTLDPSCQVTYEQAVDAGVLDAVEKPIKVAKYRGQTVRGDALAVVLLAYGPISLGQVEFAREILVQVQDKFEDAVKQRLEEARARELELEGQAKGIEERRIGIETRTGELNTIQEETDWSRSNIAADEAAIAAKDEDLKRRESQLADERKAVDDLAQQLEAMRAGFDSRSAQIEEGEARLAESASAIEVRETEFEVLEAKLTERAQRIASEEARFVAEGERLAREASTIQIQGRDLESRDATIRKDTEDLSQGRQRFETEQKDLLEFKRSVDARVSNVEKAEAESAAKAENLRVREERLTPFEAELAARAATIVTSEERARDERSRAEAALRELNEQRTDLESRETAFKEDRVVLEETRAAFDSDRRLLQDRIASSEEELQRGRGEVDAQVKGLEERQLRLAQEKESFEISRNEKNGAILSKEIELEAREQSLPDKEHAVRSQAEENARRLAELAGREETLEVEGAKLDKARAELEARRSDLANLANEFDGKAVRLREEEARRADELRTWQTTFESQQALLKEQRDTFETEAASARESWADRVMRLERREIEVEDQEAKVRDDVELVARNRDELIRREQAAQEAKKFGSEMKAEAEHVRSELEQRSLEVDSKERGLREEAASQVVELTKRTESLNTLEAEIGAKRAELERERAAQAETIRQTDMDLRKTAQLSDAKARELVDREGRIAPMEESLRSEAHRLEQERAAVQNTGKQLEAHQLELDQLRDRYESDSARVRTEAETMRQSLAIKEAEIQAERERIERDASALQETLGAKAKEMAIREKSLAAREGDLRTQEEDFEARTRELEPKERQAEARVTDLSAQAMALVRREGDLNARVSQFDETVQKFESEEGEKRRQWETLQTAFRTQQTQLNATAETRAAEMAKRAEDVEAHARALRAGTAQLELERSKLEAVAKAQSAKSAETEAAWRRSEARFAELKTKEDEILRARQSFETERSTLSAKWAAELKQLEATRDAAAVQAQQTERLVSESQRRALIAEEAEKASKRQAADLAAQMIALERRRSEADKAERGAQAQWAQIQEASRKLAAKETEVAAAARDVGVRLAKLVTSEKETATAAAELRTRRGAMDQESTRLASVTDQLATRQRDLESRASALEAKLSQSARREQTLATELQRADNLMEDLTRKEGDIRSRYEAGRALESELKRQEAVLAVRDTQIGEGQRNLDKTRQEIGMQRIRLEEDLRTASTSRGEAETLRVQAEAMQAEVSKNLRFLQKKALAVLEREEKFREREAAIEHKERTLDTRAEILEGKERTNEVDRSEFESKTARLQAEIDRLRGRLTEIEKGAGPSTAAMEEWKKDMENRVKIIQKKAMDLLDREQRLREKEAELRDLGQQLGVTR